MKLLTLTIAALTALGSVGPANSIEQSHRVEAPGSTAPAEIQSVDTTDSTESASSTVGIGDPVATDSQSDRQAITAIPGERIDPRTGEVVLTATDLVVPGAGGMNLVISRTRRSTFYQSVQQTLAQERSYQDQVGDWRLDVPYVQTATTGAFNTPANALILYTANVPNIDQSPRGTCRFPQPPYYQAGENPKEVEGHWFRGVRIIGIPGVGSQELITAIYPDGAQLGGSDNWFGYCDAGQYDSTSPTKFRITAPDGHIYYFDEPTFGNNPIGNTDPYGYMRMFVSRIEDRNGNWITYEYDNCIADASGNCQIFESSKYAAEPWHYFTRDYAYVKAIKAGKAGDPTVVSEVDFKWESNPYCGHLDGSGNVSCLGVHTADDGLKGTAWDGAPLFRLASFSFGTKTWQYKYSDSAAGADKSRYLSQVVLPNGQSWTYTASAGFNTPDGGIYPCGYNFAMINYTVGYPDGATVSYGMQAHWFMRRNNFSSAAQDSCWPISAVSTRSVVDGAGAPASAPAKTRWCYGPATVHRNPHDDGFRTWTHVVSPTRYEVFEFARESDPTNNPNYAALEGRLYSSQVRAPHPAGTNASGFDNCPSNVSDPGAGYLQKTTYAYDQLGAFTTNSNIPFIDPNFLNCCSHVYTAPVWVGAPLTTTVVEQQDVGGTAKFTTKLSGFVNHQYPQYRDETVLGGAITDASTRHWLTLFADKSTTNGVYALPLKQCLVSSDTATDCPVDSTTNVVQGTVSTYTASGNLQSTSAYGKTKNFTYYTDGDINTAKDERQNTTTYSNYKLSIPQTILLPGSDGAQVTQVVNDTGTIQSITNARNNQTSFLYDARNRLKTVTPPIGASTSIDWSADGQNQKKTITTGTSKTVNHFDGFGRLIETDVSDTNRGETIVKTSQYDAVGRLVFESYPNGTDGLSYSYDALDRRRTTTRTVDNKVMRVDYVSPETQTTTDFNQHTTTSTFKSYGKPSFEQLMTAKTPYTGKDATGGATSGQALTSYQRDLLGFASSASQGSVTRKYNLDAKRQVTQEYLPEVGAAANSSGYNVGYCRDDAGNLLNKWVGIGSSFSCATPPGSPLFTNSYDARNRLTSVSYADSNTPDVSIPSYTKMDKPTKVLKGSVEIDMDYDAAENLQYEIFKVDGYSFRLYYTYDALNHLSSIQYPSGKTVQLSPDAFGRSRSITGTLSSVDYYATGLPKTINYLNGEVTSLTPTPLNYVDTIVTLGTGNTAVSLKYDYDDNGNVKSIVDGLRPSDGLLIEYDELNRQISTQYTPNYVPGNKYYRGYDATGNVTFDQSPEHTLTMSYDSGTNRLQSIAGDVNRSLSYDGLGNMTADGDRALTFDKASDLQSSQAPVLKGFKYDGRDRVVSETTTEGTKYYLYSGEKLMFDYTPYKNTYTEYLYLKRQLVGSRVVTNVSQTDINKFHGSGWSPQ